MRRAAHYLLCRTRENIEDVLSPRLVAQIQDPVLEVADAPRIAIVPVPVHRHSIVPELESLLPPDNMPPDRKGKGRAVEVIDLTSDNEDEKDEDPWKFEKPAAKRVRNSFGSGLLLDSPSPSLSPSTGAEASTNGDRRDFAMDGPMDFTQYGEDAGKVGDAENSEAGPAAEGRMSNGYQNGNFDFNAFGKFDDLDVQDQDLDRAMMEEFARQPSLRLSEPLQENINPLQPIQAPVDPRKQCIDQVVDFFPGICRDFVSGLYETVTPVLDGLISHILDKESYPKAKDVQKSLKRKRDVDEDEEAAQKYGAADRDMTAYRDLV